jgi:hypothetical protein
MPVRDSFYVAGGTLRADAPSYVEREADAALFQSLSQGEYCYVLTSRQMGKSSLMVRTSARLRSAGVTVVVLDLTTVGRNLEPDQWYAGMLRLLAEQTGLEEPLVTFWNRHPELGPAQRWMAALTDVLLPPPAAGGGVHR